MVSCMLVVRCGRAGVVSGLQAKVSLVDVATRQRPGIQQPAEVENVIIINIHNGRTKIIQQKLTEAAELIEDKSPYYKYTPANVLENGNSSRTGIATYLRTKQ